MLRWLLWGYCLILWLAAPVTGQNRSIWRNLPSKPFNIYHQPEDSLNARAIANILREEFPLIQHDLEFELQSPVGIFIAPSYQSYLRLTGGAIPHWGEAVADPQKQIIVLKSPRWARSSGSLKTLVMHEVMHIVLGQMTNHAPIPRWFNEGVSIYFSGDPGYLEGKTISRAQVTKQLIPLDAIDAVLSFKQGKAHLAYFESFLAVTFMVEQYGESAIAKLLENLRTVRDFRFAFQKTFGQTLPSFEREWRFYLEKKYRWSIFHEFDTLLWLGIIVLFFLVFFIILIRNRRTLSKWEAEDSVPPTMSE
ncbi:MAG: peptidase MA family metallohydrolase [candidate division KSB1 bacterium]|nr:peptidase MA family metallohydrolase [candidate division KSB1 bacterium]